ncbi:MAG: GtrA family protein [Clostridiaceae bacterium]|nr:GtrA family protein [Clostridiaceae bacterium]
MRKFITGIRQFLSNSEIVRYLIIGVLTTLVNIAITTIGNRYLGLQWRYYTNKVAYVSAILFAYTANRRYVFRSKAKVFPELIRFSASRLLISLIFEDGGYYLLYDVLGFQTMMPVLRHIPWAKFFGMVFVVIANYLIGKFIVFTGKKKGQGNDDNELPGAGSGDDKNSLTD